MIDVYDILNFYVITCIIYGVIKRDKIGIVGYCCWTLLSLPVISGELNILETIKVVFNDVIMKIYFEQTFGIFIIFIFIFVKALFWSGPRLFINVNKIIVGYAYALPIFYGEKIRSKKK
jgi:hypothetical protein